MLSRKLGAPVTRSVCPKHASVRFDLATNKLEVLDLCSLHGVTVDQEPIAPLRWTEISTITRLFFGDIAASVLSGETQQKDSSFVLEEDSTDFIDCSLEETPLQGSKKVTTTGSGLFSAGSPSRPSLVATVATIHEPPPSAQDDKEGRSCSFLVPCTQQLEDSALSVADNKEPAPSAKPLQDELADDDDDMFFIPETQQPADELECPSKILDPILPVVQGEGPEERATMEEEYFQMTADNEDNSNDAIFNNKYIEESQNLMPELDESHQAGLEKRVSILQERSVDSISFHNRQDTTQDMSRIEWNESNASKNPPLPSVAKIIAEPDERSLTPELHFDDDPPKTDERQPSVTPEILFNDGPDVAQAPPEKDKEKSACVTETSVMCFDEQANAIDDDGHDISLNQEGHFKAPTAAATDPVTRPKEVVPHVDIAYDMETQALDYVGGNAYDMQTQPFHMVQDRSAEAVDSPLKAYDLSTQLLPDTYGSAPEKPPAPKLPLMNLRLRSLASSNKAFSPAGKGLTPPTEPLQPSRTPRSDSVLEIDADDLLTQPISPPKNVMPDSPDVACVDDAEEPMAGAELEAYNLQTQPFSPLVQVKPSSVQKKLPYVKLLDIRNVRRVPKVNESDPYGMETQLLVQDCSGNVYDLATQQLPAAHRSSLTDGDVSQFNPQINSTIKLPAIQQQQKKTSAQEQHLEVSPSTSNKGNTTIAADADTSFDSDDEFCLAETLPIGKMLPPGNSSATVFKVPPSKSEKAATPKPKRDRKRPEVDMSEFLTPEHPMLYLPKADRIRSASGQMRELAASHSVDAMNKPKYHFNDNSSSDSSDEEDSAARNSFKKTNVSVALEKELEQVREDGKIQKQQKEQLRRKNEEEITIKPKAEKPKSRDEKVSKTTDSAGTKRQEQTKESNGKSTTLKTATETSTETEKKSSRRRGAADTDRKSEPEKKSSRRTRKDAEEEHSSRKSDSNSSNDCMKPPNSDPKRASTRVRKETYKLKANNESVDYQSKSSSKSVPASSSATAVSSARVSRKRKEMSTEDEQQAVPDAPPIHPKTRESKRQKSGYGSTAPQVTTVVETRERPRRTTTTSGASTKKVLGSSSPASDVTIVGQHNMATGLIGDGGLADVSVTSSTGSDGSVVRSSRPRLIFTRMSPEPYRKCIARAGSKIVDIPELATILVTDRIFRTYKFLCATAKGIPIVGQSYLDALQSSDEDEPVDAWDHILSDPDTEKRYKFRLRDTLLKAQKHKLFQDFTVFVTSSTQPPPSELYLILSCAGAKATKHASQPPKDARKMFVISDPADSASWMKYREKFPDIDIVSAEGFMLSIMQHSINFSKYRLA
uniref:BRCT domain-containing protein n=1 Tax=Anopheles dirus TaxID=7168 RepID=A0A182N7U1_9DIPT